MHLVIGCGCFVAVVFGYQLSAELACSMCVYTNADAVWSNQQFYELLKIFKILKLKITISHMTY
jgi:hypothetical protein